MAVATLSPARALRRPRRADPRALIGIFLTLAALAASVAFWAGASDARPVLVAAHDLPVGSTLRASDLTVAYIHMDDVVYAAAVPADRLSGLVGHRLAEPMHAQQVLAGAQVADRSGLAPDQVAITVPAKPDTAVGGRLQAGDAVRVYLTVADKARGEIHTRTVLERASVYEVGRDQNFGSSSSLSNDPDAAQRGAIATVTLAVSHADALALAEARHTGDLDIVLLPPPEPPASPTDAQ
jgi:Flp pilus assembly protein CpaB